MKNDDHSESPHRFTLVSSEDLQETNDGHLKSREALGPFSKRLSLGRLG